MGTSASLGKGEPLPQTVDTSAVRNHSGHRAGGGNLSVETGESRNLPANAGAESPSELATDHQHGHLRALNTIQRQQEELSDLANQLQRRDEELRLIRDLRTRDGPATPDESLQLRDLRIRQLEEASARERAEAAKQKSRFKKKTRELVSQLAELRQSTTIRIMELRQEVHQLNLENRQLKERLGLSETALVSVISPRPSAGPQSGAENSSSNNRDSKSLIVELSSQLSDQAEEIRRLRTQLSNSDARLAQMAPGATTQGDATAADQQQQQQQQQQRSSTAATASVATVPTNSRLPSTKPPLLASELSFVSQASTDVDGQSQLHQPGDADSLYSDDTLLYVEMQHQQQHQYQLSSATATATGGKSNIIFDSYKQRTIDKLLQD